MHFCWFFKEYILFFGKSSSLDRIGVVNASGELVQNNLVDFMPLLIF